VQIADAGEFFQTRQVVEGFIPRYTEHALAALEGKRLTQGTSLRDFTDEELQGMSAAEKWGLLPGDPSALHPYQLRRDPGLGEAAVEFSGYFDLLERLAGIPEAAVEALKDQAMASLRGLDLRDVSALEGVLAPLREAIGRSAGLTPPFDHLVAERMERWPRTAAAELREVVNPQVQAAVEGMNLQQLQTSFRVLLEVMSLEEQGRELEALKRQYRTLGQVPAEALTALLPRLSMRLGDRNICDFAQRYRSGLGVWQLTWEMEDHACLWARERVDPRAWRRLPLGEKFRILEADNEAMDALQASRHLSRLLLTERYDLLFDPAYQVGLMDRPIYRRALDHCMREPGDGAQLRSLTRHVTRMMLELEGLVPEGERPDRFLAIRKAIGAGLKFGPPVGEG
jgi:hypothetical protein